MTISYFNMARIKAIDSNVWSHHDRPGKAIEIAALLAIIALSSAFLIFRHSSYGELLALILLILLILSISAKSTAIEINRTEATLKRIQKLIIFKRARAYPLNNFDTIKMREKEVDVEEGYKINLYSVILEGKQFSFELLSADDEKEGKVFLEELSEFLN